MLNKTSITNIYSFFLAILPIMSIYKSSLPILNAGELGLIFFSLITILLILKKSKKMEFGKNRINLLPINFFSAFLFLTCIAIFFIDGNFSSLDVFNRFIRLALWAFSISFIGYFLFDYEHTKKWIIRVAVLATIYIIVQSIVWFSLNIHLPAVVDNAFIKPAAEGYADTKSLVNYYENYFYRPASFFAEPSFYAYYSIVALILVLFQTGKDSRVKHSISILISIGLLISTSTTGIYLLILVWCYYTYKNATGKNGIIKSLKIGFFLLPISLIIFTSLLFSNFFTGNDIVSQLQSVMSKPLDFEVSNRLGGSYELFSLLDGIQRFVGVGFGNEDIYLQLKSVYYNSIAIVLLSAGYSGLIIFILFSAKLIMRRDAIAVCLAASYILLCFSSGILYSSSSIVYLTIILYKNKNTNLILLNNKIKEV